MLDTRNTHPGQTIRNTRTGNVYRVDRVTPAGAAGTSHADGPTVHAQPVRDDGTLGDYRAAIRDGSYSHPSAEWETVETAGATGAELDVATRSVVDVRKVADILGATVTGESPTPGAIGYTRLTITPA